MYPAGYSSRRISLRSRVAAAAASTAATATAFLAENCGSGSELGSGDVENAGPAYTSAVGLAFLPWCLRPAAGDDVPAGGDLLVEAPGRWLPLPADLRCAAIRMLCARNTSVAMPTTTARSRMRGGEGEISWALAAAALLSLVGGRGILVGCGAQVPSIIGAEEGY